MKLLVALVLLVVPVAAQDWYGIRETVRNSIRQAMQARVEAMRNVREARAEAYREAARARAEAYREAARARMEARRMMREAGRSWRRERVWRM
jgi:regulator of protease activity HflC (stomatin/prohibitin superfamily)